MNKKILVPLARNEPPPFLLPQLLPNSPRNTSIVSYNNSFQLTPLIHQSKLAHTLRSPERYSTPAGPKR